ncbi:MAG: hypothetical protein OT477_12280 [Chloroflexi bacterium]|nr:hypothetical protein [Chloroflexota bacterium]
MNTRLEAGKTFLAENGLNLWAFLDCATLPEPIQRQFKVSNIPLEKYNRLVLLGHGGPRFWQALAEYGHITPNPVDYFSTTITRRFITDYLVSPPIYWLYPSQLIIPLQQLGELAHWAHPSPLGLGISPQYGVWFAYRTAFLAIADVPVGSSETAAPSPCHTCLDKPCQTACPAGAVDEPHQFGLQDCARYRLQPDSSCGDRCLARLACPVAAEHKYGLPQVQYHYGRSLITLQEFYGAGE